MTASAKSAAIIDLGIARFDNKKDNAPKAASLTWQRLVDLLTHHEARGHNYRPQDERKDGPLFSPVRYRPDTKRGNENIELVFGFAADVDDYTKPATLRSRWQAPDGEPLTWCLYSSYHSRADKPKWRVVFPLATPVPASEWPTVWLKLNHALLDGHGDPACKDPARMYYLPSCPVETQGEAFADIGTGVALDPSLFPDPPPEVVARSITAAGARAGRAAADQTLGYGSANGNRPGDDYNRRAVGEALLLLEQHGWIVQRERGDTAFLRRPGKTGSDWSATFGFIAPGIFYPFTSNGAPFTSRQSYSPFAVYTMLEAGGNYRDAAQRLATMGYGETQDPRQRAKERAAGPKPAATGSTEDAEGDADAIPHPVLRDIKGFAEFAPDQVVALLGKSAWGVSALDTHAAHARRIYDLYGRDLAYSAALGWLLWNGRYWEADDKESSATVHLVAGASRLVREEAEQLFRWVSLLAGTNRKEDFWSLERLARKHYDHARTVESTAFLQASILQARKLCQVPPDRFEPKPWVIGFQNGVWERGNWREHRRDDYMLALSPVDVESPGPYAGGVASDAPCEWEAVLDRITGGDADLAQSLQDVVGYAISGAPNQRLIPWFYGPGGSGKSTIAELILTMMGGLGTTVDPHKLEPGAEREKLGAVLWGKRVVFCAEAGGQRIDAETMKTASGGDSYPVGFKYRESFLAKATHVLLLVSNDPPHINAYDSALRDRVMALPCQYSLAGDMPLHLTGGVRIESIRQDPDAPLVKQFTRWALIGAVRVMQTQTVYKAEAVKEGTRQLWEDTDPLTSFWQQLDTETIQQMEQGIERKQLRQIYEAWCTAEGVRKPIGPQRWTEACRSHGLMEYRRGDERGWKRQANPSLFGESVQFPYTPYISRGDSEKPLHVESSSRKDFPENTLRNVRSVRKLDTPQEKGGTSDTWNAAARFIADRCIQSPDARVRPGILYGAYCDWAADHGETPRTLTAFGPLVVSLGYEKKLRDGYAYYRGIQLREVAEESPNVAAEDEGEEF